MDKDTATEIEASLTAEGSCRSGDAIGGGVLLPMTAGDTAAETKAEYIIFVGINY